MPLKKDGILSAMFFIVVSNLAVFIAFFAAGWAAFTFWRVKKNLKKTKHLMEKINEMQRMPLANSVVELARDLIVNKSNQN